MNGRGNNFNLIRLLAALLVLGGHSFVLTGSTPPSFLGSAPHRLGIILFFTVGGYLITESWKRDPDYLCYLIRRVFRIFPALITCIAVLTFMIGPLLSAYTLKEYFTDNGTWNYLKNMRLYVNYTLPGVFSQNPISTAVNGSLWSLPVEFFMYLLIPAIYEVGRKGGGKIHILLTVSVCGISAWKHIAVPEWSFVIYGTDLGQALEVVPYYFLGSLAATLEIKRIWNLQLALILYIICQCLPCGDAVGMLLAFAVVPYIVFSFAFCENPFGGRQCLRNKLKFSYGLYLYGFFAQQLVIEWLWKRGLPLRAEVVMVFGLILAGVLAVASEKLVEEPARKLSHGLIDGVRKCLRQFQEQNKRRENRE